MASSETYTSPLAVSKERRKKKVIIRKPKSRSSKSGPKLGSPKSASPPQAVSASTASTSKKSPVHKESSHNVSIEEAQHTVDEYFGASPKSNPIGEKTNSADPSTRLNLALPVDTTRREPIKTQAEVSFEEKTVVSPAKNNSQIKIKLQSAKKKLGQRTLPNTSPVHTLASTSNKRNKKKITQFKIDKKQSGITDHFYVRRSGRKCASTVKEEERRKLEEDVLSGREDGLEVRDLGEKGRGIFSVKAFRKGEMVCEYAGELIHYDEAKRREQKYQEKPDEFGCYMYYFNFRNKKYCVDATAESGRLGRLLNHSRTASNVATKQICIKETPHLILVAARDISTGEELLYDYDGCFPDWTPD